MSPPNDPNEFFNFFDPFAVDGSDPTYSRRKAYCKVIVSGVDITDQLDPHLISVRVSDGETPYNCELELDDRDGRLPIPPQISPIDVELGWDNEDATKVFHGQIMDVEHAFGRKQGGRRMFVHGIGENTLGTSYRQPAQNNWGAGAPPGKDQGDLINLSQVLGEVAGSFGASLAIHPTLGALQRDYWSQSNESPMHFLRRMANEVGAVTRVEGDKVVFTKPGQNTSGDEEVSCTATWGKNLIGWRVHPWFSRGLWGGASQQYFDLKAGQWQSILGNFNRAAPWVSKAVFSLPSPAPNANVAQQQNDGADDLSGGYIGTGTIVINGEPKAAWNTNVLLIGARPGVDGTYRINKCEHFYSRQGYITTLTVVPSANAQAASSVSGAYLSPIVPLDPNANPFIA